MDSKINSNGISRASLQETREKYDSREEKRALLGKIDSLRHDRIRALRANITSGLKHLDASNKAEGRSIQAGFSMSQDSKDVSRMESMISDLTARVAALSAGA